MDELLVFFTKIISPLYYPLFSTQRIFWLYLLGAVLLAFLVYRTQTSASGVRGFLRFCLPASIYKHRSAVLDYKYYFVNRIAFVILFLPLMIGSSTTAAWVDGALGWLIDIPSLGHTPGPTATLFLTLVWVIVFDAGIFAAHYLQHKLPFLWAFHKVHHSAEVLTPVTVYRMHPVDDLLTGTMVGLLTGIVGGVFRFVHVGNVEQIYFFGLNAGLFLFYFVGYNLRHSHVWLPYPRALSHILVSPAQHQIHHSNAARHYDKNLGFIFAIWDWMAGTLYVPKHKEELTFGLADNEHLEYSGVTRLYFLPIRKLTAHYRRARDVAP
jgi:sterol desaturase/sphingolipid hydroxylase (fatty acid hydroxylase superfamily)